MTRDDERIGTDFEISTGNSEEIFSFFTCYGDRIFSIEIMSDTTSSTLIVESGESLLICTDPGDELGSTSATHECFASI